MPLNAMRLYLVTGNGWPEIAGLAGMLAAAAAASFGLMRLRRGRTVGARMTREVITVTPDALLDTLVGQIMLPNHLTFVPVVEEGVLLGHVDSALLAGIDRENWTGTRVEDVYAVLDPALCVPETMPVTQLLERMRQSGRRRFMVTHKDRLCGVISLSDLPGVARSGSGRGKT
ncbi:CBS domain-containing protein [Tropicibacter oceani]|uniref:CBS domain-containing protein n=1 Tax=Tropicibacter oceani TaxID=3058420 RepID=A0ABY8QN88_9RHOB|nr:CBS domain-containing protein [Tropicibacter oceani]WGW06010.1 CBS domain-containing protein [Tropicibacter oceani]